MKSFNDIQAIIRKNKKELKDRYGLKEVGIFGSYVRGEQDESSDVDLLVEVERPMGFIKFIKLENHFSQILGVKADLVTKKALKPNIGRRILQEVRYVYKVK